MNSIMNVECTRKRNKTNNSEKILTKRYYLSINSY